MKKSVNMSINTLRLKIVTKDVLLTFFKYLETLKLIKANSLLSLKIFQISII